VSSFASDRSRSGLGGSGFGSTPFGSSASGSSTFTSFAGALRDSGMRALGLSRADSREKGKPIGTFGAVAPPPPPSARTWSPPSQSFIDDMCCVDSDVANVMAPAPGARGVTDEDKLHQIVMLQSSSGMFPSTAALAHHLGFESIVSINAKLPTALKSVSAELWMTALVCVYLETKLAKEKEAWELVVEKAWAYIVSVIDATKTAELKKAAGDAISAWID